MKALVQMLHHPDGKCFVAVTECDRHGRYWVATGAENGGVYAGSHPLEKCDDLFMHHCNLRENGAPDGEPFLCEVPNPPGGPDDFGPAEKKWGRLVGERLGVTCGW